MSVTLPDGRQVEVHDLGMRQLVVPVGTTIRVPEGHEWHVTGMAVLPTRGYTPPLGAGEVRDARAWGDLQIRVNDATNTHFRANVLTLIDRYWGRYNLDPHLPEVVAKLTHAQHAMYAAPKISELYVAVDHAGLRLSQYLDAVAPRFEPPLRVDGGARFTVEHVASDDPTVTEMFDVTDSDLGNVPVRVVRALDVELLLLIKRPVS